MLKTFTATKCVMAMVTPTKQTNLPGKQKKLKNLNQKKVKQKEELAEEFLFLCLNFEKSESSNPHLPSQKKSVLSL